MNNLGEYIVPVYTWTDDQTALDKGYTELIRCANCKYWSVETEQTAVPNMRKCTWWRTIGTLPIDFCSRAERKDNAKD